LLVRPMWFVGWCLGLIDGVWSTAPLSDNERVGSS